MHTIKAGWSGQVYAIASSNDSGGRKSRIRRSKEERKGMVESFIIKYQKSNNGNFPSLNLTHKEVGGSFYTVREIVREIIQENRVLAPPKVLFEEEEHSRIIEQHPLGSLSMEPHRDLLASDIIHRDDIISPLELDNEKISGVSEMVESEEVLNCREQALKLESLENGKIINGDNVLEENLQPSSDKPITEDANGHCLNETDCIVDKTREFRQRIFPESAFVEILDRGKNGATDVDASKTGACQVNSEITVEKFPLRPVPWSIHDVDSASDEVHELAVKMEFKSSQHDQMTLNLDDITDHDPRKSSPDETKSCSSAEHLISENPITSVGRIPHNPDPPTVDRISHTETRPANNPLLALLKGIASAFIKLWTE